jgi:hypothetical protein
MHQQYEAPAHRKSGFHCPHCGVWAHQEWAGTINAIFRVGTAGANGIQMDKLDICRCAHCAQFSIWFDMKLVYPASSTAPPPNSDMPEDVQKDYLEARGIVNVSPRGAAAMLRLALQKLMVRLGETGKDINTDIGSLVRKGLPVSIQQALDAVRVIGNESVHPGTIDLRDDPRTTAALFGLLNLIVQDRITQPKAIEALYSKLPPGKLEGIKNRDGKA